LEDEEVSSNQAGSHASQPEPEEVAEVVEVVAADVELAGEVAGVAAFGAGAATGRGATAGAR